jgi:hypothetical protein
MKRLWRSSLRRYCSKKSEDLVQAGIILPDDADGEIAPYWKALESRVINRKSRMVGDNKQPARIGVRKTEEDFWLEAGVYDSNEPDRN